MEKVRQAPVNKDNLIRHLANLALLHGVFYKGTFYWYGQGQKHENKQGKVSKKQISR